MNAQNTTYTLDLNTSLTQVLADGTYTYLYGLDRLAQFDTGSLDTWYFLGDALGSVRQLTDTQATVTLSKSYAPYGEPLDTSYVTPGTPYGYTGEYTDPTGMVYLRARYYAPWQGRFVSRDTWGGDANSPMSYNMWLYGYANPVLYTDPTGKVAYASFVGEFTPVDKTLINSALRRIALAYLDAYNDYATSLLLCAGGNHPRIRLEKSDLRIFQRIHGGRITFTKYDTDLGYWAEVQNRSSIYIYGGGTFSSRAIYDIIGTGVSDFDAQQAYKRFITHEVGHAFNRSMEDYFGYAGSPYHAVKTAQDNGDLPVPESPYEYGGFYATKNEGWQWRLNTQYNFKQEIFADMFIGWVYDRFARDPNDGFLFDDGSLRASFMDTNMPRWIYRAAYR